MSQEEEQHEMKKGEQDEETVPETPLKQEPQEAEDNSFLMIKKRTKPFINASLIFLYVVLSSMFIIGCVTLNRCSLNRMIPVYLIVAGSTGILTKALIGTKNKHIFNILILLVLFDLSWQGFGSFIVYKEYQPNYDPSNGPYCDRTAYLLSFWIITIIYTLITMLIFLSLCYILMRNSFTKA